MRNGSGRVRSRTRAHRMAWILAPGGTRAGGPSSRAGVLSPRSYNEKTSLALFCPITSMIKGYPFEVPLPSSGAVTGVVLADRVRSLDWRARGVRFAVEAPSETVSEARETLAVLLG